MRIYFSGIGGAGIGPLAQIAKDAGYDVSGSDQQNSDYIQYLISHGIEDIHIGQTKEQISSAHAQKPFAWLVYSSAVSEDNPELLYAKEHGIKMSKRDEFTNQFLKEKNLKLVAIAGTHGKTTTTAMVIWLFKQLGMPISYSVGAKLGFGDMGEHADGSDFFVYECDEFDRNFLSFQPYLSLISGVTWDHHEVYPTREDYQQAFRDFINKSQRTIVWQREADYLGIKTTDNIFLLGSENGNLPKITLAGKFNREDARLAVQAMHEITKQPLGKLIKLVNEFPGLTRRMEQIAPNLYSDYAHTPEKIRGAMSVATEMAGDKKVIVVYEPLTNRRQHYMAKEYSDCFDGAAKVYWIPSYLAREDSGQKVLSPAELIKHMEDPSIAQPMERDENLKQTIKKHLSDGDIVVCMAGGGGDSLDEWIRKEFA